jgi:signal-transduction protein with cAMP-binding, CBS, and nucleotidyltransferase domain
VKEVGYYEAEILFINELNKEPCLYYIKKGELRYESGESSHTFIRNLYNNDTFGAYEFFTQLYFKSHLRAAKYSLLFYLKANEWRKYLKDYRSDFERYYETKDEILLYNNGGVIAYKCDFCCSK